MQNINSLTLDNQDKLHFVSSVTGVQYLSNFISAEEEQRLIDGLDAIKWSEELKRRTQQYGAKFNYRTRGASRAINEEAEVPKIPDFMDFLTDRLLEHNVYTVDHPPDQLIVNEYNAEQGIAAHIDAVKLWGPTVCTLSLGCPTVMNFTKPKSLDPEGKCVEDVVLEPKSLVVLKGPSRYEWRHEIARGNSVKYKGTSYKRDRDYRRISLTFRTIMFEASAETNPEDY